MNQNQNIEHAKVYEWVKNTCVIYLVWIISAENPFTFNTFKCLHQKQDKTAGNHNKST